MNSVDAFAAARPDVEVDEAALGAIAAELFDDVARRPGRPVAWRVLAVAAAVVALVTGLAVIVGRPERTAPADTVPPAIDNDGEPLRMLPSEVEGLELTGFLSGRARSTTNETVLARPLADGSYVDKVVVRRGPKDNLWFDTTGVAEQGEIEITALSTLGQAWDVVTAGPAVVFAQTDMGDGTAMQVSVDTTSNVERSRDAVVTVATSLGNSRVQPPQGVAFDPVPAGFEVVTDVGAFDPWTRFLLVERNDFPVLQVVTYASDDPDLAFRLMSEDLRPVTVRGVAGFASTMLLAQKVMWQEAPGRWVVVQSDAGPTTADELIAFAETLRVVSPDEWDAAVQLPAGWEPGYPATTLPSPATTAPAPVGSTTPPATTALQTAPSGRVLVANGSNVSGVAGSWTSSFRLQGADVLEAVNALLPGARPASITRVYARAGSEALGAWVAEQFGDVTVEPFDSLDPATIEGGVGGADVVAVVGTSHAGPSLAGLGAPLVIGNSVTMGAEVELKARGYVVDAEVSRVLVDVVPWIREAVAGERSDVLVLQVADNGPFSRSDLDALLAAVSEVPNVILVNSHADREWADPNNSLLAEVDVDGDNLILMDWDSLAEQCPGECFASDGVHLSATGAEYFAETLGEITGL